MTSDSIEVRVNGAARSLSVRAVSELLRELGLEGRSGIAVAVNGSVVPRAAWPDRKLAAGDEVEIVGAAQGG